MSGGANKMLARSGEYLGQVPPKDSALLFAPNIVSTGANERDMAITPDGKEIFFCREVGNFSYNTIFHTKQIGGKWTTPEVFDFCTNAAYKYIEPHISPDGNRLYFVSNMSISSDKEGSYDIWVSEKKDGKWLQPKNIGFPVNTDSREFFPSVTTNGTIYYTHLDTVAKDEFIYRSRCINGVYQQPEKLGANVNMGEARFNSFIAPDESFIIVPSIGMPDSFGKTDYYIVFRDATDKWSKPINMGSKVNCRNSQGWSASLSPDGKYLFFMSTRMGNNHLEVLSRKSIETFYSSPQNGNTDIYWISTSVIDELRKKAVFE
jgi:Periplasmic component of the Tol biopolymer transport system